MALVYFLLFVMSIFAVFAIVLAPVGILIRLVKSRAVNVDEPEVVLMPDREYKVNVRAAKKYLKSRGYSVVGY